MNFKLISVFIRNIYKLSAGVKFDHANRMLQNRKVIFNLYVKNSMCCKKEKQDIVNLLSDWSRIVGNCNKFERTEKDKQQRK